jgi:Flp pilus assembly protein TadG
MGSDPASRRLAHPAGSVPRREPPRQWPRTLTIEEDASVRPDGTKRSTGFVAHFERMLALIADFRTKTRGNVAIIFAISAIPMLLAVGVAVDYTMAAMVRTKLQAAADAATLAAVSISSPVIATAQNMTSDGNVTGGSDYAVKFFKSNVAATTGYTNLNPSATVTKTGRAINATVSFTAQVPTFFMGLAGPSFKNVAISSASTSTYTQRAFINFYLMIDVSASMGFPSTAGEQTRLTTINPDVFTVYKGGCSFACHINDQNSCPDSQQKYPTNNRCQGYTLTRKGGNNQNPPVATCPTPGTANCIQLRIDAVAFAVQQLLQTANSSMQVANQFQVGLYPFINQLYAYFPLTSSLSGSATSPGTINYAAAQLSNLLDSGPNTNLGSGGTSFTNAFAGIKKIIGTAGNGVSSSSPLSYIFLVTDGVEDDQSYSGNGNWSDSQTITNLDTSQCTKLKNEGITIAILYIPYQPIQNPTTFSGNEDGQVNALIAGSNGPDIPTNLKSCASTNFFYTANTPADITNALIAMFEQAASTAHVTN